MQETFKGCLVGSGRQTDEDRGTIWNLRLTGSCKSETRAVDLGGHRVVLGCDRRPDLIASIEHLDVADLGFRKGCSDSKGNREVCPAGDPCSFRARGVHGISGERKSRLEILEALAGGEAPVVGRLYTDMKVVFVSFEGKRCGARLDSDGERPPLLADFRSSLLDPVQIFTFLVFLTFYVPCLSTFAVMLKTLGRREAWLSVAISLGSALLMAGAIRLLLELARTIF